MTGPRSHEPRHLFVYGTLLPGEVRWQFLEPFVDGPGTSDLVTGTLYDTGVGYPALQLDGGVVGDRQVRGMTFQIADETYHEALATLDEIEGAVDGLYSRVVVATSGGVDAFVYIYGGGLTLVPVPGGSWLER